MAEDLTPRNTSDDELTIEQLEEVAGGSHNTNCGTNCSCSGGSEPIDPSVE